MILIQLRSTPGNAATANEPLHGRTKEIVVVRSLPFTDLSLPFAGLWTRTLGRR